MFHPKSTVLFFPVQILLRCWYRVLVSCVNFYFDVVLLFPRRKRLYSLCLLSWYTPLPILVLLSRRGTTSTSPWRLSTSTSSSLLFWEVVRSGVGVASYCRVVISLNFPHYIMSNFIVVGLGRVYDCSNCVNRYDYLTVCSTRLKTFIYLKGSLRSQQDMCYRP